MEDDDWTPVGDDHQYFVAVGTIANFVRNRSKVGDATIDVLLENFVAQVKKSIATMDAIDEME